MELTTEQISRIASYVKEGLQTNACLLAAQLLGLDDLAERLAYLRGEELGARESRSALNRKRQVLCEQVMGEARSCLEPQAYAEFHQALVVL